MLLGNSDGKLQFFHLINYALNCSGGITFKLSYKIIRNVLF